MTRRKLLGFVLASAALGFVLSLPAVAQPPANAEPIRIGMAKSFFNDVPGILVSIATGPFNKLMKDTTGLTGKLSTGDDAFEIADKLESKQLSLGVFHGHEFAWVQKKNPKLKPIMVVANRQHDVRAYVIVKKDSNAERIKDLRGKTIDIPLATKEHCRAFLTRNCSDNANTEFKAFFGAVKKSATQMDAMDEVCRGKLDAVLVDSIGLAFYKEEKKFCFENNLRVLEASIAFPQAVIAYREGAVDAETLKKFHDGLLDAHKNPEGSGMMKMWCIEAFETVPADYSARLAETLKAYPMPEATKVSQR
jgi:ABC-type phosphate/phosphonate transport system substrate-binding protein